MKGKLISSKTQYLYQVWITSLLLGYFGYVRPLETLLTKIRQAGISSISVSTVMANLDTVLSAIIPTIVFWGVLSVLWLVAIVAGSVLIGKKTALCERIDKYISNKRFLDTLFYIGALIEMVWAGFYYSSIRIPFATALVFIALQCFALRIVLTEHTKKEWIWIACLTALGLISEFYTTRGFILRVVLLIFASKSIDLKKIMKCYLAVEIVAFLTIFIASALGITGLWVEENAFRTVEETANRYTWGYNSPNTTQYILVRMGLVTLYIWWDKVKLWQVALAFVANLVLYGFTDSRTAVLAGAVACILAVFFKCAGKLRDWKLWYYLAIVMILFFAGFSLHFLQWNFDEYDNLRSCPQYVYVVSELLVGRVHQAIKYTNGWDVINFSLFGNRLHEVRCDMGYIKLCLQEGIIFYALYLMTAAKLILSQRKNRDYAGYIIVVAISIRMMMESSFVSFVFQNPILLLMVGGWHQLLKKEK